MATKRRLGRALKIEVSNADKVLYPDGPFTKQQVVEYYLAISRWLLPHFKDRPVTLKRYPDGMRGDFFYEKDAPSFYARLGKDPCRGMKVGRRLTTSF